MPTHKIAVSNLKELAEEDEGFPSPWWQKQRDTYCIKAVFHKKVNSETVIYIVYVTDKDCKFF